MIRPHRIIGENYLHRWHILPRNRFFNIYLHRFVGSDDDRALHDHPFASVSFLLNGELIEVVQGSHGWQHIKHIKRFFPVFRRAKFSHRLVLVEGPAWTVFVTGPVVRKWGFWCGDRWVYWKDFVDASGNGIGRGCE